MNKRFNAAAAAGVLAVLCVSTVSAADIDFYGSFRFGATMTGSTTETKNNQGSDPAWDVGTEDLGSRIGLRVSTEFGNSVAAGVHQELRPARHGTADAVSNMWMSGQWGKLTLGWQSNPFTNAAKWDQAQYFGRSHDIYASNYYISPHPDYILIPRGLGLYADERIQAARYDMSRGPFNLAIAVQASGGDTDEDAVDNMVISVGYNFGVVNLDVARLIMNEDTGYDYTAVGIDGSQGPLDWYIAYQAASDNNPTAQIDVTTIGGFVSFSISRDEKIYWEYVTHDVDTKNASSPTETILGYSHQFGGGVSFTAEYLFLTDNKDTITGDLIDLNKLILAMNLDF